MVYEETVMNNIELKDTIELMNSADYKDRFKAEYYQLKIRFDKLKTMVEKWDNGTLNFKPTCPREMYDVQLNATNEYLTVLEDRAKLENVEI
jgi:hypothetical protein